MLRRCSWKRTRLRLSGCMWLQHADLDLGSLGLERSPFCVSWAQVWSGAGEHGRSNRATHNSLPALWQRMEDLATRNMAFGWNTSLFVGLVESGNTAIITFHLDIVGKPPNCQSELPSWAALGKVQPWRCLVATATATDPMLGAPWKATRC